MDSILKFPFHLPTDQTQLKDVHLSIKTHKKKVEKNQSFFQVKLHPHQLYFTVAGKYVHHTSSQPNINHFWQKIHQKIPKIQIQFNRSENL